MFILEFFAFGCIATQKQETKYMNVHSKDDRQKQTHDNYNQSVTIYYLYLKKKLLLLLLLFYGGGSMSVVNAR